MQDLFKAYKLQATGFFDESETAVQSFRDKCAKRYPYAIQFKDITPDTEEPSENHNTEEDDSKTNNKN